MTAYPTDEQIDQALEQGKKLSGDPKRTASVSLNGENRGYVATIDLDDPEDVKRVILEFGKELAEMAHPG